MDGGFACPECGYEVQIKGLSPGRQVRCGWCEALVEVPFIPRAPVARAKRRSSKRRPPWVFFAWGGVFVLAIVVLIAVSTHVVRSQARAADERELARLLSSAGTAEAAGRFDQALTETDAAIALAQKLDKDPATRVEGLRYQRDVLARRELRARIDEIVHLDPASAVGECLTLLARIEKSPKLSDLEEPLRALLDRVGRASIVSDLDGARKAAEAGRPDEVIRLCDRVGEISEHLPAKPRAEALEQAKAILLPVARKSGIVIAPILGVFSLGTAAAYTETLRPVLTSQLKTRGYAVCPASSRWCTAWEGAAAYRIKLEVKEEMPDHYMQSKSKTSVLTIRVVLTHGASVLWERSAVGRTEVPLPKLPAYQAARIATGERPNPEVERMLYDNAHAALLDQLGRILRALPVCGNLTPDMLSR